MSLRDTGVWLFPGKWCGGAGFAEAFGGPWGVAGARRWVVVEGDGRFVTAREHPRLVLVTPTLDGGVIRLAAPGLPDLVVPVPDPGDTGLAPVRGWSSHLDAAIASDEAVQWSNNNSTMDRTQTS